MSRLVIGIVAILPACAASTSYKPRYVARGELTLRYENRLEIYAGHEPLAQAPGFDGLAHHVRCVPRAQRHAQDAQREGKRALGLAWAGGSLGVAALGGLSGLAFLDSNRPLAFSLLGAGVAAGLLGVGLAAASLGPKGRANGHAVDAINYYNDAVGSIGGTCENPPPLPPPVMIRTEEEAPPAVEPAPPSPAPEPANEPTRAPTEPAETAAPPEPTPLPQPPPPVPEGPQPPPG